MKTQGSVWSSRFTMILISFGILGLSPTASALNTLGVWENHTGSHSGLILEPVFGYLSTSNNFDSSSTLTTLLNGASNTRFKFDLNGTFGINEDFFLFGRLSLLSAKVTVPGQADLSGFGLADQQIGAAYRLFSSDSGISFNAQVEAIIPAYSNSTAKINGSPYFGDGSMDFDFGGFFEFPLTSDREVYLEAGGAYAYRSKGFSSAIPYTLLLKREPSLKGFLFEGGFSGQISLKTDIATQDATARSVLIQDQLTGSAGGNLINALNPAWIQGQGKLGYKNGQGHSFYLGASAPITGTNAPSGMTFVAGAVFDFGPHPTEAQTSFSSTRAESLRSRPSSRRSISPRKEFSTYNLDAKVTSSNDQLHLIQIDKGSSDFIEKGQVFDIFNEQELIARAKVTSIRDDEAVLNVIEYYQDRWIEIGFVARRLVR